MGESQMDRDWTACVDLQDRPSNNEAELKPDDGHEVVKIKVPHGEPVKQRPSSGPMYRMDVDDTPRDFADEYCELKPPAATHRLEGGSSDNEAISAKDPQEALAKPLTKKPSV